MEFLRGNEGANWSSSEVMREPIGVPQRHKKAIQKQSRSDPGAINKSNPAAIMQARTRAYASTLVRGFRHSSRGASPRDGAAPCRAPSRAPSRAPAWAAAWAARSAGIASRLPQRGDPRRHQSQSVAISRIQSHSVAIRSHLACHKEVALDAARNPIL